MVGRIYARAVRDARSGVNEVVRETSTRAAATRLRARRPPRLGRLASLTIVLLTMVPYRAGKWPCPVSGISSAEIEEISLDQHRVLLQTQPGRVVARTRRRDAEHRLRLGGTW
jgi:hypothetical protein